MSRRQIHIDAAKLLASHLIVLHHFTAYGPLADALESALPAITEWFFAYARMAVQVFLVLGGYLAAASLAPQGLARFDSASQQITRRFVRLVVPYSVALLLAVAAEGLSFFLPQDLLLGRYAGMALAAAAIGLAGLGTYKKGLAALRVARLNINALMSVAVTGAFAIGQWPEAAMVMALYAIAELIEASVADDLVRGVIATDGLIGTYASMNDASLEQNRCFLYHVIGGGTGDWDVPVGGMGAVTGELARAARIAGAELVTGAEVTSITPDGVVTYRHRDEELQLAGSWVLANVAPSVLESLVSIRPRAANSARDGVEGAQVKVNLLLSRLPRLKDTAVDPAAGTVTIDHGPIPGVNWPAMTMAFTATPTVLQKAKVGDQVQFDVTVKGPAAQVTDIRPQ